MKSKILNTFIILCISSVVLLFAHANMSKAVIGFLQVTKNLTITAAGLFNAGSDGNGIDVKFFTDTATEEFLWDASANGLFLDGTNAANVLTLSDGNLLVTDDIDVDGTTNLDVVDIDGAVQIDNTVSVGIAGTSFDVQFFSATSGDHLLYDVSDEKLVIIGTDGQNALEVTDGDVVITDATTLTGGVVFATMTSFIWSVGGASVLATSGTDQAPTGGPRQWVQIYIPYNVTLTGIGYMVGSVGGTDSVVVELKDSAGATVVRSIASDTEIADIVGTTAQFNNIDFSSTYNAVAGIYYIVVQFNGTTARVRTYGVVGSKFVAATAGGTFKTDASITPGTTFTADEGPISYVY